MKLKLKKFETSDIKYPDSNQFVFVQKLNKLLKFLKVY